MFIRYTIYRNEEREDIILEPGLWDKGTERHQDLLPQCHHAQLRVSPRTVNSVTTHSQECHHAQQTEQTVRILLDPSYFTQPFISSSFHLHQTHSLSDKRNSVKGSWNIGTGREPKPAEVSSSTVRILLYPSCITPSSISTLSSSTRHTAYRNKRRTRWETQWQTREA